MTKPPTRSLTGGITFFEGNDPIPGCGTVALPLPVVAGPGADKVHADCTTSWPTFGTKAISAVYYGDPVYNAAGDTVTLTISAPTGNDIAPIEIETNGNVKLYGPTSGVYKGLVLFQNRASALSMTINPGAGSSGVTCSGAWLTQDVPDVVGVDPPPPCGALGGLRGTIYSANEAALVFITASGLANLQVIAGKIQIDSDADTRFAFTPQFFANGSIRLVE